MIDIIHKIIDNRKFKKSQEYLDYLTCLDLNKKDTERFANYYCEKKDSLDYLRAHKDSYIGREEEYLKYETELKEQMQRWAYDYERSILEREFIRPNNQNEIDNRNRIADTFGNDLIEALGSESNLRFHGTPIYYAKQIIKSGGISSTADRYDGYIRSTDLSGTFSASTIDGINRSINYFTDFASYHKSLPCGVLFVLTEQEGDYELRGQQTMQNVNFYEDPSRLVGIVCTDEVKDMIIDWCNKKRIDSNKVFTYDGFIEYARDNNLEKGRSL